MSTVEQPVVQIPPDYARFAALAGPLTSPPKDQPYRVRYHGIHRSKTEWLLTRLIALALVGLDVGFIYWLIFKSQYPDLGGWLWQGDLQGAQTDDRILLLAGMAFGSPAPLINPGPVGIDACLWAKDPGASDGPCNGGPAAGQYCPGYALQLARAEGHGALNLHAS